MGRSRRIILWESGFSLLELMIVLVIVLTVTGAIFQVINLATQRSSTEQVKLDMFQEAREFMDQMARDLRQAGYPNPRNVDQSLFEQDPVINDKDAAVGIVKIDTGDLWFEGDVDGSGKVYVVQYHLDTTSTGCPCLKRSQLEKVDGDPINGQTPAQYQIEVQGVQDFNIFSAFNSGATVTLPKDISSDNITMSSIDTIQATLTLRAATVDPQTHVKPVSTLITTVRLNNCNQAAKGFQTSCQ
jgi:prepilin-type N-terminal cleavage/methylation domain-containing protein